MKEHVTSDRRPATYQDVLDAPENMVAKLVRAALRLHPRMPAVPDAPGVDLAPDCGREVPSPGTRGIDLTDKRDIHGAAGVACLWLVESKARTPEAFERRSGAWTLLAARKDGEEAPLQPFHAVALPLSALWPD